MATRSPDYAKFLSKDTFVIFLLHGVVENHNEHFRNYNRKHIEAEYFYDFLNNLIQSGGHPVSMEDILAAKNKAGQEPAETPENIISSKL